MEDKKETLKKRITEFVETVLNVAEKNGNLDYFNIEISNHQGNLQMDYTLKDRKKVY
jgi:hypothetical protein